MKKPFMSKDARRIMSHLDGLGIEVNPGEDGLFDVEVCCSQFFPTHIIGVITKCLSGKTPIKNLYKAQELGWAYFARPVRSLLTKRVEAWQPGAQDEDQIIAGWSHKVYSMMMSAYMPHDVNRSEADLVIYTLPYLCDQQSLVLAISAAKDRSVRSVSYVKAILERERAKKTLEHTERAESAPIWEPPSLQVARVPRAVESWERAQRLVDIDKLFPRHI